MFHRYLNANDLITSEFAHQQFARRRTRRCTERPLLFYVRRGVRVCASAQRLALFLGGVGEL